MEIFGADASPLIGGGVTLGGALLAVMATLRYIKRTEEDSVEGMRVTIRHMEQQLVTCREESRKMNEQINRLTEAFRMAGLPFPDGFWDQ